MRSAWPSPIGRGRFDPVGRFSQMAAEGAFAYRKVSWTEASQVLITLAPVLHAGIMIVLADADPGVK